ncbi:hypothetical protein [Methylobacterium oryzae]|uniref:hypothetical protein n=1 Tax=Methylobacterium oryzae TaxID=334852 RepID=UPI001F22E155|nr:hypothetical protein [Methylobacterium oryzae]UIN36388.1 hypothetical protein LXM90_07795 [Methylobacterium oryzae]
MKSHDDPNGDLNSKPLSVILPSHIAEALDAAAGDALCGLATLARQLIASGLRESGHLAPLQAPRRYRGKRKAEAA